LATTLGVRFVAIVRKGRQSAARQALERRPRFRKLVKWRTGSEGRISALKRNWGWSRSLMDGLGGTEVWCGYGVFAHNSQKISGLIADQKWPTGQTAPTAIRRWAAGNGSSPRSQSPPALPITA
jgi:IS5 family transposase